VWCSVAGVVTFYHYNLYKNIFGRKAPKREPPGDLRINRKIILKWMSEELGVRGWAGFNWLRIKCNG
jgi:hypothetical protein